MALYPLTPPHHISTRRAGLSPQPHNLLTRLGMASASIAHVLSVRKLMRRRTPSPHSSRRSDRGRVLP